MEPYHHPDGPKSAAQPPPVPQPPPAAASIDPASFFKLTRGHSCVLCQQRKVRCDKNKPCSNCVKAQVECVVVPPHPPRRRKNKPNDRERDLFDRLRRYEALLAQHGVRIDEEPLAGASRDAKKGLSAQELDDLQHGLVDLKTSPSLSKQEPGDEQQGTDKSTDSKAKWSTYNDYRDNEEYQQDSSDDENFDGSAIHRAFDGMFGHHDGFPFVVGGAARRVTEYHPPGIQIFQLWHVYLTNVNPLLKITHSPTLQAQLIEAGANVARIPPALEALMFTVYFSAIMSMHEEDVQSTFDEQKTHLLARYHRASEQALLNAGFMSSSNLVVLQAYLLYLYCVREHIDPRALFCLIGIAVRIAQRLGLHRDGDLIGLPPFEVELRRRLWWQLVLLDKRIAEMTGSTFTALACSNADTQFPLNINDADLHAHAKVAPAASAGGATEMLFCLTRVEIGAANKLGGRGDGGSSRGGGGGGRGGSASSASSPQQQPPPPSAAPVPSAGQHTTSPPNAQQPTSATAPTSAPASVSGSTAAGGGVGLHKHFHFPPNPNVPDIFTHVANQNVPDDTDTFCARIEATYLQACDPKIPLHLFTLLITRQALCKLRVARFLAHTGRGPRAAAGPGARSEGGSGGGGSGGGGGGGGDNDDDASTAESDAAFIDAVRMVEYDNVMQSAESLRGYVWYTRMHFPLPAYMLLVPELLRGRRHAGALAERAWAALAEQYERRRLAGNLHNPVNLSFGAPLVKAWDAHEAATARQQPGRALSTPRFIQYLRQQLQRGALGGGGVPEGGGEGGGAAFGAEQPAPSQYWDSQNDNSQAQVQAQLQAQLQHQHQHHPAAMPDYPPVVYQQQPYQPPPAPPPQPFFDGTPIDTLAPQLPSQIPAQISAQIPAQIPSQIPTQTPPPPMMGVGLPADLMEGLLDWTYFVPQPQSEYGYGGAQPVLDGGGGGGGEAGGPGGETGTGPGAGGFGGGYGGVV